MKISHCQQITAFIQLNKSDGCDLLRVPVRPVQGF